MKYLDQIKSLVEKGVEQNDESVFGFHGTSIEAIKHLAISGRMPNSGLLGQEFHFCPSAGKKYLRGPYNEAVSYAQINASRNALIAALIKKGIQLDRQFITDILGLAEAEFQPIDEDEEEAFARIRKALGISKIYELNLLIRGIRAVDRGLIISILPKIEELDLEKGVGEDWVVNVPQGLPIDYIAGIVPLSEDERKEIIINKLTNVKLFY